MIGTKGLTSPQIEIPASAVGLPRVGHPHATGGLCDLPACNAANYDGHEVWGDATAYARDHHPDGSVCEMFGPCGRDICHKARCAMTNTQGLTSPNDPLAHVKRDDPDPTQTHGQCECEAPLTDQRGSWLCTRELGHVGQHIAGCIDHVGAVWPAKAGA